jgi:beta-lactamase superfamily II metal-dependent hydrolase
MIKVHSLNVGHGDSYIVETISGGNSNYSIVDCKKVGNTTPTIEFLSAKNVKHISAVFISHFHSDHCSGIPDLLDYIFQKNITVNYICYPCLPSQESLKLNYLKYVCSESDKVVVRKVLKSLGTMPKKLKDIFGENTNTIKLNFIGCSEESFYYQLHNDLGISVLSPNEQEATSIINSISNAFERKTIDTSVAKDAANALSLVLLLKHPAKSSECNFLLFTGDLDNQFWRTIKNRALNATNRKITNNIALIKLPHHGKHSSEFYSFLYQTVGQDANFAVCISNRFNDKNHPGVGMLCAIQRHYEHSFFACSNMSFFCNQDGDQDLLSINSQEAASFVDFCYQSKTKIPSIQKECADNFTIIINEEEVYEEGRFSCGRLFLENCHSS